MKRLLAVLLLTLAACAAPRPGPERPALTFGAVPLGDPAARQKQLSGLASHLERRLGQPVKVEVAANYREFSRLLAEQRWTVVMLGPVLFSRVQESGYQAVAVAVRGGKHQRPGILVARKDQPVTVVELKGRKVAFVAPHSAAGFEFPFAFLYAQGLRPGDYEREFLGSHDAVLRAVLDGKAACGATYEGAVEELVGDRAAELTQVGQTDPIPGEVFAVRTGTPELEPIRRALLELDRKGAPEVLAPLHADALAAPTEGLFDGARAIDLLVTEAADL